MLLMLIGCPRQFRQSAGAQRVRLFRTTDRDRFEYLVCGKCGGRSRGRAEVSNALYKVELIRRRASWVRYWRSSLGLRLRLAEWRWSNFKLISLQLSGTGVKQ